MSKLKLIVQAGMRCQPSMALMMFSKIVSV